MKKILNNLVIFIVLALSSITYAQEVCIPSEQAADIIALLEASEEDIILLDRCTKLVKELETEIDRRDKRIVKLTNDLIRANTEVIDYKVKLETAEDRLNYSLGGNVILTILLIAPLL